MKIKAYICPSCGAPLDVNYDTTFTFCPNCGNRLHISYEGEAAPKNPDLRQFTDAKTGTPLASAVVPPDYTLKGALNAQWQSDAVPFTATVQAVSPDRSVILTSSSKETFEEIRDPIQKMVARIPVAAPAWLRDFVEPEAYLQQYAEGLSPLKRYIDQLIAAETEETAIPETTAQGNPYQYWDYYNGYAYESAGQLKYWIEFRDEFYLHCLFRSGESEPYEEVYTLYPDWEAPSAQQLTIRTVKDENGNDITDRFVSLDFLFSSEDVVLMQVRRDEQTLAGGEEDNLLTGEYILKPREEKTPEQLCVLAQEYYKRNYDFYPPEAAFTDNGDGTYTIRLYENVDLGEGESHTATSAWYTVDTYGVGIDEITGRTVDLTR